MAFPDVKYPYAAEYSQQYFALVAHAAKSVTGERLRDAARLLGDVYAGGASVYSCGNGGSASIANHLVCDHVKGVQTDTTLVPHVVSLSSNIEIITAIADAIAYADIYVFQLRSLARAGDVSDHD